MSGGYRDVPTERRPASSLVRVYRPKAAISDRAREAWRMHGAGVKPRAIAAALGVSLHTVRGYLVACREEGIQ